MDRIPCYRGRGYTAVCTTRPESAEEARRAFGAKLAFHDFRAMVESPEIDPLAVGWKRDPWTPSIEGNLIFGAGIRNMKSGVSSLVAAAEAVRKSGISLKGDLVLACVVGELQGGVGTTYLCRNGPLTALDVCNLTN